MTRLKSIRLPNSLEILGDSPFARNHNLEEVYLRSFKPPYYRERDYIDNTWGSDNLLIYVPKGFEGVYKQTVCGWSKFANCIQGYKYDDLEIPDYYISQDYTRDGEVVVLQKASEGAGINLILMGDGYSDRQIENGSYFELMNRMMEDFFSVEPFTTYRRLFNVYAFLVISETEGYEHGGQALGGDVNAWPRKVDVGKCWEYSERLVPYDEKSQLIIAAMNLDSDGGVAQMWGPNDRTIGDYGNGNLASVVSITANSDLEMFRRTLIHEVGHGFAKLDDEYSYGGTTMPQFMIEERKVGAPYGWWKNVDFTSDITEVKWSHFLVDERYKSDGLGCYEGACTYEFGAWRPSEDSVMGQSSIHDDFNAPSREAIWYRIHKLAYGDSWVYNYEDFVASGTAVIDDAFLQQGIGVVHDMGTELRGDNAAFPAEINVADVDAAGAGPLIHGEHAFVKEAVEAFETGEALPEHRRHLFHEIDGLRAADGEEDNPPDAAVPAVKRLYDIIQSHAERSAGGDDVPDGQYTAGCGTYLFIPDVQTGDDMLVDDALAGDKMHVSHANANLVAGFFQRIIESAAKDGQDIPIGRQAGRQKVSECGDRFIEQGGITGKAYHFGRGEQFPGSGTGQDKIAIIQLGKIQFVQNTHKNPMKINRDTKLIQ